MAVTPYRFIFSYYVHNLDSMGKYTLYNNYEAFLEAKSST